jgi:hypothetical protein
MRQTNYPRSERQQDAGKVTRLTRISQDHAEQRQRELDPKPTQNNNALNLFSAT